MHTRRRLKIAVAIKNFAITGGAEKYAVEIATRMVARGHEVHVYAREVDSGLAQGMTVHRLPYRLRFSSVLSLYAYARQVSKQIQHGGYDIVHSHDRGFVCDVATIHTFSYRHNLEKQSVFKKLNDFYLSPRGRLYGVLEQKQMRSRALVAVSPIVKADIKNYSGRSSGIHVVTPGVDVDAFSPVAAGNRRQADPGGRSGPIQKGPIRLLFVGSEFRRKGLDALLRELPDNTVLTVVGKGERHDHYQQLVHAMGLDKRVIFEGLCDDVRPFYLAAHLLVLPSLREAFGMAALEAMACGLPVVVSTAAGVASIVDDGHNGFVFSQPSELRAILERLSDPEVRKTIGGNARCTAMRHTWERAADQYEAIYGDVCDRKRKRQF
jgi:UDP-glucose:(heptosyl)LPS alpha-1,3-glucosyltransferase